MADYTAQLRVASFRGLPFLFPDDEATFGRRIVTHQFPGRDDPYHEDLGKDVNTFAIEATITGPNFMADADAFEAALLKAGPGTLIHPWYGSISVVFKTGRRRHSTASVGETVFSITFERDKPNSQPSAASNTSGALTTSSQAASAALSTDFLKNFNTVGMPDFITQDSLKRAISFTDQLNAGLRSASVFGALGTAWPSTFDTSNPTSLVGEVAGLFSNIVTTTQISPTPAISIDGLVQPQPVNAVVMVRALSAASLIRITDTSTPATPQQSTRITNAASLDLLMRGSALAAATASAAPAEYASRNDAIAVRQNLADNISQLHDDLTTAGWDNSAAATADMLAAISSDINDRIGRLPLTALYTPLTVRTSLALANRLYGDDPTVIFSRGADIAARNKVRHPGFIPAKALEVLIDV